mgnify:CR=1 FL=1
MDVNPILDIMLIVGECGWSYKSLRLVVLELSTPDLLDSSELGGGLGSSFG